MNWFSRQIVKVIPGLKQEVYREARSIATEGIAKIKAQVGIGWFGSHMSGGAKYRGGLARSGAGLFLNHALLRQNVRRAVHDTPQAKALVQRFADTTADIGLRLEATPMAGILGISPEDAESWAQKVEERFDLWAGSKKQHRSQTMNFYQSQHLYQEFLHRDNDMFTRLFYSKERSLQNPLQFEFIDPNQIMGDTFTSSLIPHSTIHDGIVRDAQGRETHYKIWFHDSKGRFDKTIIPARSAKTGRIMMLHGFSPEYAGQKRGFSRLAHAIQEFQNLTDFTLAQIIKAINQSQLTLYVKPSKTDPASNPLEDLSGGGLIPPTATTSAVDETITEEMTGHGLDFCPVPEATSREPGGTVVANLQKGEDLKTFGDKTPADNYETFVDAFTSHLSASVGMPIEVLKMKFSSNYSASRASLILFWRIAQIWREEMAADFLNPIYEMWLSEEIAAGRIQAPGWSDPRLRAAWLANRWIGSPMPNIDPMRTANADKVYVELGAQTLDRVARNHNGSSGQANRRKLNREFGELPTPPWAQRGSQ